MARTVKSPGFDFESASNQLALMAQLANKAIQLDEVESFVDTLALHRYSDKIADASKLGEAVQELRARFASRSNRTALGDQRRQAGGLTLRSGSAAGKAVGAVEIGQVHQ